MIAIILKRIQNQNISDFIETLQNFSVSGMKPFLNKERASTQNFMTEDLRYQ